MQQLLVQFAALFSRHNLLCMRHFCQRHSVGYQSVNKLTQESRAVARKPSDADVNFDTYHGILFYNGIARFPCHSTAFLLVYVCSLHTMVEFSLVAEIDKNVVVDAYVNG